LRITGDGVAHCQEGKTTEAGDAIRKIIGVKGGATSDGSKGVVTFRYEVDSISYFEDLVNRLKTTRGVTRVIIPGYNDEE